MKKINKITRKFRRFSSSDSRRGTMGSGAGTNFKVGVGGAHVALGKKICRARPLFWLYKYN